MVVEDIRELKHHLYVYLEYVASHIMTYDEAMQEIQNEENYYIDNVKYEVDKNKIHDICNVVRAEIKKECHMA